MKCVVCNCESKKYKCPKCLSNYCSVPCYTEHKKNGCTPIDSVSTSTDEDNGPKPTCQFRTEDTVDPERLVALCDSKNLKNLLQNPHLRKYLKDLDNAPNASRAMTLAMQEPLFIEFADECLKVVEHQSDDEQTT